MKTFKPLGVQREAWMSNMVPTEAPLQRGDDLAEVRADQARLQGPRGPDVGVGGDKKRPRDSSEDDEKAEERKDRGRKKKKKKRKEWRVDSQKELTLLFKDTGVDPDASVRRRFRRRAAKLAKQKTKGSGSSSASSSSSTSMPARGDMSLFGASNCVQAIGKRLPGALGAAAVEEIAENLVTQDGGLWETHSGALPLLYVRYYKHQLASRMSPAMSRETHTLCQALDLMLRGRIAESVDLCSQRVKALEMMMSGVHYTVAQQQEMLPREGVTISTTAEFQEAARRAREDGRARAEASRPYGSRGQGASGQGKADDWGKGSGKKGDRKGKTGKADGKKTDPKKAEGRDGKGS